MQNRLLPLHVTALSILAGLTGCLGGRPAADDTSSTEQQTFMGDLGFGQGTPVTTGSTLGASNDFVPTCSPGSTAPDASYRWTAPVAGNFEFHTSGSAFNTVLEVRDFNTNGSLGCNDDSNGTQTSKVTTTLAAGQDVRLVIDGVSAAAGEYHLNITQVAGDDGSIPTSGLHLWLRSNSGVESDGTRVSRWLDQSGNGRHATMIPNVPRRPFFIAGALNGKPVVEFTGAQSLTIEGTARTTRFSLFLVGKNNKTAETYSMILGPGGNSPNHQLRWNNGTQVLFVGGGNFPVILSPIADTRAYHALSALYTGNALSVYRNGNLISSHSFTTSSPWILASLGSYYSQDFMQGDVAELIMYDRALSESERLTVNAYLRGKYNLP